MIFLSTDLENGEGMKPSPLVELNPNMLVWDVERMVQTVESPKGVVLNNTLGRSQGYSDFPEERSPKGKYEYLRDLPWANFPDEPFKLSTVFHTFGLEQ